MFIDNNPSMHPTLILILRYELVKSSVGRFKFVYHDLLCLVVVF